MPPKKQAILRSEFELALHQGIRLLCNKCTNERLPEAYTCQEHKPLHRKEDWIERFYFFKATDPSKLYCNLAGRCREERLPDRARCVKHATHHRDWQDRWKKIVIEHFNFRCECCGEPRWQFLEIDHKEGDGGSHRRRNNNRKGVYICIDIVKAYYCFWWMFSLYQRQLISIDILKACMPKVQFAILCATCNKIKSYRGECLHKKCLRDYEEFKKTLIASATPDEQIEGMIENKASTEGWKDTLWLLKGRGLLE